MFSKGLPKFSLLWAVITITFFVLKSIFLSSSSVNSYSSDMVVLRTSIAVFPVTNIMSSETPSANKCCLAVSVGAKCRSAITPVSLRFISSGKGSYLLKVRRPASTCPIVIL